LALALSLGCGHPSPGASVASDRSAALRTHVANLASEAMGGRLAGTPGEWLAADYLVAQLEQLGAQPLPGHKLRIPFDFAAGTSDGGSSLSLHRETQAQRFTGTEQVRALSFSSNGRVRAPVVFAGYGLVTPDSAGVGYDSYAGLDVAGKVVVVLRYFPEDAPDELRSTLSRYAGLRYKALAARERDAAAILVVTGPRSPNAGKTVPMTFDTAVAGSGILAGSVDGEVGSALFRGAPQGSLEDIQRSLDDGNPHARGFALAGVEASIDLRVERETRRGINVVGVLPGTQPDGRSVLLGAHYDHLGNGTHGHSLARDAERGRAHPGADDNASGVAAVLEIGQRLSARPARHDVILAFWSGEELGLLGSTDFVKRALVAPERLLAVLNFDMVGRVRNNQLVLHGTATSPAWTSTAVEANAGVGFDLALRGDPHLPTDSIVFDQAQVPTLTFFSGAHADYHRPTDTADRVNSVDLARVVDLATGIARALADTAGTFEFVEVERSHEVVHGRGTLRAYTGTVPDYTAESEGLKLSDVVKGGAAQKAGLRGGDVIVSFAGQQITNIYDYTYALDAVKIGQPVEVRFRRDGVEHSATLVPGARP